MRGPDAGDSAEGAGQGTSRRRVDTARAVVGAIVVAVALTAAGLAIDHRRQAFVDGLRRIGVWPMLGSLACGLIAVAATYRVWSEVLRGLDPARSPGEQPERPPPSRAPGPRVFFVSQLGKYLPGSVWPVVMQMEAGRARGIRRRTMLAANLITLLLSCTAGLLVACLLLPLQDARSLGRYWWVLLALPFMLALLHPRALPALLDRLFALVHRPPLGERLDPRSAVRAAGWSLVSWAALGAHLWVLCIGLGHGGLSVLALATGGMALSVSLGVLFIPAPAGAGIRDVVLALLLRRVLGSGGALAVVVSSRAIIVVGDVILAGLAASLGGSHPPSSGDATDRLPDSHVGRAHSRDGGDGREDTDQQDGQH